MEKEKLPRLTGSDESTINIALGRVVHRWRKRKRLSLEQIARSARISRTMLSYVERGLRKPTVDLIDRIARALDTRVDLVVRAAHRLRSL